MTRVIIPLVINKDATINDNNGGYIAISKPETNKITPANIINHRHFKFYYKLTRGDFTKLT